MDSNNEMSGKCQTSFSALLESLHTFAVETAKMLVLGK